MQIIKTTAKVIGFSYVIFGNDIARKAKLDCNVKGMNLAFGVPEMIDVNFVADYHEKLSKGDTIAITQTLIDEGDVANGRNWDRPAVITSFEIL